MLRIVCVLVAVACNGKPRREQPVATPPPIIAPATATVRAGIPMDLRVRVVTKTGEPARNVAARVYHTDAEGYYKKNPDGSEAGGEHARLSVIMRTDGDGRFTLRTIVPAPYPTGGPPAHVHLHVPPDSPDDLTIMLDSDPKLDRERIAKMARTWIGRVRVEAGVAICEAEITAP
ncbi:MAG TPA: hypothetical protein VIV11_18485 [Kofleriaceae bacterium]